MTDSFYDWPLERQAVALGKLAEVALRSYEGTFSAVELVKYRENAIFAVKHTDGARLALRIHRHGYHSDAALGSELLWMQALADDGIEVPEVVATRDGRTLLLASVDDVPEPRQIDLLHWLDGQSLGALEARGALAPSERRALYSRVGALAARLHDHSSSWSPPPGFVRHTWFAEALLGEEPLWGRFWELASLSEEQAGLLQISRDRARQELNEYGVSPENSGLIHADLLADNVLVDGTAVRPIDFDDCGFGWHMFEIATILYFALDDPDFPALRQAVLEGYRSVRPLSARDEATLPLFLLVRGMSYLGWVHTRSETATARQQAPMLVARCCALCERYLESANALPSS